MKITYLGHSGTVVELTESILVFDYYKGSVPPWPVGKKVYVFVSHVHFDHYNPEIFCWERQVSDITYILSDDILEDSVPVDCRSRVRFVGARKTVQIDEMTIKTLRSTDEGVAFFVQAEGKRIYHAGDLHWWHWKEEGAIFNEMMRRKYQGEIKKLSKETIDLAFLPADPRQEEAYVWGMAYFLEQVEVKRVCPIHLWGKYDVCRQLKEEACLEAYQDRIVLVTREGEVFEWED